MDDQEFLARRFEEHRARLAAVAHRLLGSAAAADDAVQETWLRLARSDGDDIDNLAGWLTTVVSRVCLDELRARQRRREQALDPATGDQGGGGGGLDGSDGPEQLAVLADSVGPALLVVLGSLSPAERLAFVLHDVFDVPFEQIAPIVDRSPVATRKLASRARRRVRGADPAAAPGGAAGHRLADAFVAAARGGDLAALLEILDPDVALRSERPLPGGPHVLRGAGEVAGQLATFHRMAGIATPHPVVLDGRPGFVNTVGDRVVSVLLFTAAAGRIVDIEVRSGA